MKNKLTKKNISLYVLFLLLFLLILFINLPFESKIKNKLYDTKLLFCSQFHTDRYGIEKKIVTIAIDDLQTIPQIGYPTYFYHNKMIEKLSKLNVSKILYDLVFQGNIPPELLSSIAKSKNVYIPVIFELHNNKKDGYKINQYNSDVVNSIMSNSIPSKSNIEFLWNSGLGVFPNKEIINVAAGIGHISSGNDEVNDNSVFRKAALLINVDGHYFPSISLLLACDYFRVPKENIIVEQGKYIILPNAFFPDGTNKNIKIPINEKCEMLINFIKPWNVNEHDFLEPFWFVSVLNLSNDQKIEKELNERLKGKICIIGNASSINKDVHNIPIDTNYPGIGIHSHILYTILSNNFIVETSKTTTLLISLFFIILLFYFASTNKTDKIFIFSLILIPLYFIISYVFFIYTGIAFDDFLPVAGILLFGFTNFVIEYIANEKEVTNLKNHLSALDSALSNKLILLSNSQEQLLNFKNVAQQKSIEKEVYEWRVEELEEDIRLNKNKIQEIENEKDELKFKIDSMNNKIIESDIAHLTKSNLKDQNLIKECAEYGIITQNTIMLELFKTAKKIAKNDHPVLLLGDSGTGKELFAQAIQKMSLRKNEPFVTINIPAIPDNLLESELFGYTKGAFTGASSDKQGKFELANKGTVFLDEIGDMKIELQAKILRVLQEKTIDKIGAGKISSVKVDVRLIAATNRNLIEEVKKNNFREDLFYRINVFTLKIPSLKDRKDDVPYLIEYFLTNTKNSNKKISRKAVEKLMSYSFVRNNIRELENIMINAIELSEKNIIQAEDFDLPSDRESDKNDKDQSLQDFTNMEDDAFWNILEQNNFKISIVSEKLSQSRTKVGARLKGICFKKLSENKWNFELTAEKSAKNASSRKFLLQRFNEYYENINKIVKESSNKDIALEECLKRFRNLNKRYHKYIEEAVNLAIN